MYWCIFVGMHVFTCVLYIHIYIHSTLTHKYIYSTPQEKMYICIFACIYVSYMHMQNHVNGARKTCCNTLITLQHTATHCNTMQHTATHCNTLHTLQLTATHCNTLQHTATQMSYIHIQHHIHASRTLFIKCILSRPRTRSLSFSFCLSLSLWLSLSLSLSHLYQYPYTLPLARALNLFRAHARDLSPVLSLKHVQLPSVVLCFFPYFY